jgi:hypothetical protein
VVTRAASGGGHCVTRKDADGWLKFGFLQSPVLPVWQPNRTGQHTYIKPVIVFQFSPWREEVYFSPLAVNVVRVKSFGKRIHEKRWVIVTQNYTLDVRL